MDAGLIILYMIELVIVFVFGIVIFFKKRELDELDETCNYLRIKASSNSPLDSNAMLKVIQEEGHFPTRDPDGNIEFKIQGTTITASKIANYFCSTRIYYNIDKESIQAGLYAANIVNQSFVAIKTLIKEDEGILIFSVESYCKSIEAYRDFFQSSLQILSESVEMFREEMSKISEYKEQQQMARPDLSQSQTAPKILS